jgi:hypothetical protein
MSYPCRYFALTFLNSKWQVSMTRAIKWRHNGDIPSGTLARSEIGAEIYCRSIWGRRDSQTALCRIAPRRKCEHLMELTLESSDAEKNSPHRAAPLRRCEPAIATLDFDLPAVKTCIFPRSYCWTDLRIWLQQPVRLGKSASVKWCDNSKW